MPAVHSLHIFIEQCKISSTRVFWAFYWYGLLVIRPLFKSFDFVEFGLMESPMDELKKSPKFCIIRLFYFRPNSNSKMMNAYLSKSRIFKKNSITRKKKCPKKNDLPISHSVFKSFIHFQFMLSVNRPYEFDPL